MLFFLQLSLFVLSLKRKQKIIWKELFTIEIVSLISIVIYATIYETLYVNDNNWDGIVLAFFCLIVFGVYILFLTISIIIRIIVRKKLIQTQEKSKMLLLIAIITIFFIICTTIDIKPLIDERIRRKIVSKDTITYLNNRYGNGNYEIQSIKDLSYCFLCVGESAYELIVKSDYLDEKIKIKMSKDSKEVIEDNFLYEYYDKNYALELENIIQEEMNNLIPNTNDYKVNLDIYIDEGRKTNYGKIPTIEELKKGANITFNNFMFYKNFDNEEDFKSFIIDVYKHYLLNYKKYNNSNMIDFTFVNGNPFFEDYSYGYYKNSGYIKEQEENIFIYNNASPIVVSLNDI